MRTPVEVFASCIRSSTDKAFAISTHVFESNYLQGCHTVISQLNTSTNRTIIEAYGEITTGESCNVVIDHLKISHQFNLRWNGCDAAVQYQNLFQIRQQSNFAWECFDWIPSLQTAIVDKNKRNMFCHFSTNRDLELRQIMMIP
mmetsp:Transcript_107089/g.218459  ORF Transcript_107089/g.218459 Transcript_107089/m.218459 type:complete len:144 (+) Transcript_107089:1537-1968(+)